MRAHKRREAERSPCEPKTAIDLGGAPGSFTIKLRFDASITGTQQKTIADARDRWEEIVVGGVPRAEVDGEEIDGLLIEIEAKDLGGPGGTDARTPAECIVKRPKGIGAASSLPARGLIIFDTNDLNKMESEGALFSTALHEIGHALGIGTIWIDKGRLQGADSDNPTFTGPRAMKAYGDLLGGGESKPVPVENNGTKLQKGRHWRRKVFGNELMTVNSDSSALLSLVTVESLKDLGYEVNPAVAEAFDLAPRR